MYSSANDRILFQLTWEDEPYLPLLKSLISGRAPASVNNKTFNMAFEVATHAKSLGATRVATTSQKLLEMLVKDADPKKRPTIDSYSGSIFHRYDIDWLIIDPLEHLHTVPHGSFLLNRFLSKFLSPGSFLKFPSFSYEVFDPSKASYYEHFFSQCDFISIDIETGLEGDRVINCCSFTGVELGNLSSIKTVVVPFIDLFRVIFTRRICGLSVPKVFQNGKYDIAYFLRYQIIVKNYAFDTINLFHSWYSELPKDLATIIAFCLRDWIYHKEMGKNYYFPDPKYLEYNARDSFSTALCLIVLINEMPPYALQNYIMEFPQVFPCILAEMTGIRIDIIAQKTLSEQLEVSYEKRLMKIRAMVGNPHYNPGSWQQNQKLFEVLGSGDIKKTDKIGTDKVMSRHPLNKRILTEVIKYKEEKKRDSAYTGKEFTWYDRCYYSINPHATDTGRMASKESAFWCGLQIQNVPADPEPGEPVIKDMFVADIGFYLGECDGEQNEARCTGYISGDKNLIATVESGRDYHSVNAERFFGIPYDKIISPDGVKLNKPIRNLSKRTNHGANYNMGAGVLLDTMGIDKVISAKQLLHLPAKLSLKQVTQHLLNLYDAAYPVVRSDSFNRIKNDVSSTSLLVGPTGWTRFCFMDPTVSKRAMNAYAAHVSQSLAAMLLNRVWLRVFFEIALPEGPSQFRLLAQIHDSILFMYAEGREDLAWKVKKIMEEESVVDIKDTFGIVRTMRIPAALKGRGRKWSELEEMKIAA